MTAHSALGASELHECKQVKSAGTGDAGKVITPSSSTAGEGTLRNLLESEISQVVDYFVLSVADITTAGQTYFVAPASGTITSFRSALQGAIGTADELVRLRIGGTLVTDSQITIAYSGSAAGDVDSATPSANNTVSAGAAVEIEYDGASTGSVGAVFTVGIRRS